MTDIDRSWDFRLILRHYLLALQLPSDCHCLLHLDHVALPRPPCGRIPRRLCFIRLSQLCHSAGAGSICQWSMDVGGWVLDSDPPAECVLEVRVPLH